MTPTTESLEGYNVMKQAFRNQRISPKKYLDIKIVNSILDEYMEKGYRLTLRQLFYQLVARDRIRNTTQEYSKLSSLCVFGRMNGLIDWRAIEDRLRKPYLEYYVDSIEDALEDTISSYKLNRQDEQPLYLEVWTEKDAVSNILKRVTRYYHINLIVNRGYSSCSAMYDAAGRMNKELAPARILYVGDHDPSGLDMLRDIHERLSEFEVFDFEVIPVALTMEQIRTHNPPPNPAKTTDPRAGWYIDQFGTESWELDALPPEVLEEIVGRAVVDRMNLDRFNHMLELEELHKQKLQNMLEGVHE